MSLALILVDSFLGASSAPLRLGVCSDLPRSPIAAFSLVGAQHCCAPFQQDQSATNTRFFRYN
jgi:hypothetical protein